MFLAEFVLSRSTVENWKWIAGPSMRALAVLFCTCHGATFPADSPLPATGLLVVLGALPVSPHGFRIGADGVVRLRAVSVGAPPIAYLLPSPLLSFSFSPLSISLDP